MFNNGDPVSDSDAADIWADAHPTCIECDGEGCIKSECPGGFCNTEALVKSHGEHVHVGCRVAFERLIENKAVA